MVYLSNLKTWCIFLVVWYWHVQINTLLQVLYSTYSLSLLIAVIQWQLMLSQVKRVSSLPLGLTQLRSEHAWCLILCHALWSLFELERLSGTCKLPVLELVCYSYVIDLHYAQYVDGAQNLNCEWQRNVLFVCGRGIPAHNSQCPHTFHGTLCTCSQGVCVCLIFIMSFNGLSPFLLNARGDFQPHCPVCLSKFVVPCPINIMLNHSALLQDLHLHANLFSVEVLLRPDNTKGHHLKSALVSIFGHVLSGLWSSLPTTAELFRIPAHDLLCHLLMLLTKTESGDAWMSPASLSKYSNTVCLSLFQDVHLFPPRDAIRSLRAEGQTRDRVSTCCPPFTQYSRSESVWGCYFMSSALESTLFTDLQIKKKTDEKVSI